MLQLCLGKSWTCFAVVHLKGSWSSFITREHASQIVLCLEHLATALVLTRVWWNLVESGFQCLLLHSWQFTVESGWPMQVHNASQVDKPVWELPVEGRVHELASWVRMHDGVHEFLNWSGNAQWIYGHAHSGWNVVQSLLKLLQLPFGGGCYPLLRDLSESAVCIWFLCGIFFIFAVQW